jgi:integrase
MAEMVRTRWPGIYKRGSTYAYTYRDRLGKQRWGSAKTVDQARRDKAAKEGAAHQPVARQPLMAYLREWVDGYQGTGRKGFREETRTEYRADIERWVGGFFTPSIRLDEVDAYAVTQFVAWLVKQPNAKTGGPLSDSRIKNIMKPLRAGLRSAVAAGLIERNPCDGVELPHRPRVDDDEHEDVRPLSPEQLELVLSLMHPRYRLLGWFLTATGLRASEVIGLEIRHLALDGERPHLLVRQRVRRGKVGPIKSRHARREIPLDAELVGALRVLVRGRGARDPVFCSTAGTRLQLDNVRNRYLRPAGEEAGCPWVGWHTFRHTCASLMFSRGDNLVAVSRFLGHHSPSFTLDTYVHLFEHDRAAPVALPSIAAGILPAVALSRP